jgi:hypothetical protein
MVADILTILFSKLGFYFILDIGRSDFIVLVFHNPVPYFNFSSNATINCKASNESILSVSRMFSSGFSSDGSVSGAIF